MLHYQNHTIASVHFRANTIERAHKGSTLVYEGVRSCYGSGGWLNEKGWLADDGWRNA